MKVLFTFGGLPHYYNYVLSKLNNVKNIEIVVIIPKLKSKTLGEGVHQNSEGINFKVIELEEYITFYGKYFFKDFLTTILQEAPEIIVITWPYILAFVFDYRILNTIQRKSIKLIYKDIPFRLPKFWDGIRFHVKPEPDENLNLQNDFLFKINTFFITIIRKIFFNIVDAHVDYIEVAYEIFSTYGVDKKKIFITYNSPDTDKLLEVNVKYNIRNAILPYNPFRIIHVGRLVKWKRVDLLIKALKSIENKFHNIELIIIGNGPEKKNLEELINELDLSDKIKFIGGVYDEKILGEYFSASAIYVLAGMGGLSINEAMCFAKPIICSVCDGTEKHLVFDDYNGKYFMENDVNDLANKIEYLLSNPQKIKKMGENSEKIIREKININTVVNGYIKAFNFVMGGTKE